MGLSPITLAPAGESPAAYARSVRPRVTGERDDRTLPSPHQRLTDDQDAPVVSEGPGGSHHDLVPRTAGVAIAARRRLRLGCRSRLAARGRRLGCGDGDGDRPD